MAFPFEPNKQSKGHVFYDIRMELPGFETVSDATKESQIRQNILTKGGHSDLAEKLFECGWNCDCTSPACPQCSRTHRRGFYHAARTLSNQYDEANQQAVTLAYYSEAITSEELEDFDPKQIKDRLRQQLVRCDFQNPVIGGLELDYHDDIDLWIPHFHLLVLDDARALETLRKQRARKEKRPTRTTSSPTSRPMLVQSLKNPSKQLSYLCKQRWQLIRSYPDPVTGKRRTKKYRLEQYEFILALAVLDGYTFSDLMFTYKVRVNSNEFRLIPSVFEEKGETM